MRTRTLLLLAVTCGLAILLAGGFQLLRLANQSTPAALAVGSTGAAGDATVKVVDFHEADGVAVITVTLSGVDDPSGLDGFRLQTVNELLPPNQHDPDPHDPDPHDPAACTGITVVPATCTLAFGTSGAKGASRQLVFRRAAQQVRWRLK
jgi:hypothetical protein